MKSIWTNEKPRLSSHETELPKQAEVVIIGGGMAGLLCSYQLKEAGIPSIVLEAEEIGSGQTERTTAKITSQHGLIYDQLTGIFDGETSALYGKLNQQAIDEYERIIRNREIACEFEHCTSSLYTEKAESVYRLEKEYLAAKRAEISAVLVSKTELPFPTAGALRYDRQAQFHPLKFINGIIQELTIFEHTRVIKVEEQCIYTNRGNILAEHVVVATHFPFMNFPGYYFARMHQERSYVLACRISENIGNIKIPKDMYYGIDKDGMSFRRTGDTLLLGGFGHRTGNISGENPYDMLRKKAGSFWPDYKEIAAWSAQDCMTLDHLPYIGKFSKKRPNWYVVTGFGKWGMTGSMVAALAIRDLILGRNREEWEILSPQRKITKEAVKNLWKEAGHTAAGFLMPVRPRCPHLGCRLVWNPYERSWECPCHGSRFQEDGRLLDDPAQNSLKKCQ